MNTIHPVIDASHYGASQMLTWLRAAAPVAPVPKSPAVSGEAERQPGRQPESTVGVGADRVESTDLNAAVDEINVFLLGVPTHLEFRVDDGLDRLIVSVVDSESGEILRQLPPDEVLRIAQRVREADFGLLDSMA